MFEQAWRRTKEEGSARPAVVSMQSHVAYGHVGNAVAQFVLQRLGCEVTPLHTVLYSNHLGYPQWRGRAREVGELEAIIEGLAAIDVLACQDALLLGFLGGPKQAELALSLRADHMSEDALLIIDPVMGDHGELYVDEALVDMYREAVPARADVCVPNRYELELLSRLPVRSLHEAELALESLEEECLSARSGRSPLLVVTGVLDEARPGEIFVLARWNGAQMMCSSDAFAQHFSGAGDLFAATLTAHLLCGASVRDALTLATRQAHGVLEHTVRVGSSELALVAAQHLFTHAREPRGSSTP